MDFSEFKRRLGAEPRSQDPDMLAARQQGPEHASAAREAQAFEDRLEGALALPVDEAKLLDDVLRVPRRAARTGLFALAASLLAIASAAVILWNTQRPSETLPEYLLAHYEHDGGLFLTRIGESGPDDIAGVLARFGLEAAPALAERIGYIKICRSLHGDGAHMVVRTNDGWVTVFYLPGVEVEEGLVIPVAELQARMLATAGGAVAMIGPHAADDAQLAALLHDSLRPTTNGA